jgi:16S rRNA processing protein RimM
VKELSGEESAEELITLARATKTRGLKGELVADLLTDFPERFETVSRVFGIGPKGERQELELENHWIQNDRVVLKFSGYDNIDSAKALVGFSFALPEEERVELPSDEFYDWELEGCSVETNAGASVGTVSKILRTGGVELLVVEDDAQREYLVPMAESIVVSIDVSGKRILIDPPEGLLDL